MKHLATDGMNLRPVLTSVCPHRSNLQRALQSLQEGSPPRCLPSLRRAFQQQLLQLHRHPLAALIPAQDCHQCPSLRSTAGKMQPQSARS